MCIVLKCSNFTAYHGLFWIILHPVCSDQMMNNRKFLAGGQRGVSTDIQKLECSYVSELCHPIYIGDSDCRAHAGG